MVKNADTPSSLWSEEEREKLCCTTIISWSEMKYQTYELFELAGRGCECTQIWCARILCSTESVYICLFYSTWKSSLICKSFEGFQKLPAKFTEEEKSIYKTILTAELMAFIFLCLLFLVSIFTRGHSLLFSQRGT